MTTTSPTSSSVPAARPLVLSTAAYAYLGEALAARAGADLGAVTR